MQCMHFHRRVTPLTAHERSLNRRPLIRVPSAPPLRVLPKSGENISACKSKAIRALRPARKRHPPWNLCTQDPRHARRDSARPLQRHRSIAGADPLAVLRRVESRGTFELAHRERSICSRVVRYARAAERQCRDVADDLITLLVPGEAEPMAAVIAYSQVAANPLRPRAVNRRTLAINTVARRAADWMDAARFVLLGFLYEGRGRTS